MTVDDFFKKCYCSFRGSGREIGKADRRNT